jgi:Fe-S-cluster containining protein
VQRLNSRELSREAAADYRRGLSYIDEAFEQAREKGECVIPCKRGCSSCCSAVFDLPPADGYLLRSWLEDQEPALAGGVRERSAAILESVRAAAKDLEEEGEACFSGWDPLSDGLGGLPAAALTRLAGRVHEPCPLVGEDGECLAHESRPALCRLGGLPWRDPETGSDLPDFCRLEPEMAENTPQELDLARLDGLRWEADESFRRALPDTGRALRRSFVAAVLAGRKGHPGA